MKLGYNMCNGNFTVKLDVILGIMLGTATYRDNFADYLCTFLPQIPHFSKIILKTSTMVGR